VQVIEKNVSATVPGASSTIGATVGVFNWGPVMVPQMIGTESELVSVFGKPNDVTAPYFFSAANFLSYSNAMYVVRADANAKNATADGTGLKINNLEAYQAGFETGQGSVGCWAARYPGALGNSLAVYVVDSGTWSAFTTAHPDLAAQFRGAPGTSEFARAKAGSNTFNAYDELHVLVVDRAGLFTGTPGATLEKYEYLSKASDALSYQGTSNYYANVITNKSQYIYWMDHPTAQSLVVTAGSVSGSIATLTFSDQGAAPYVVGGKVVVAGMTPAEYNGTFTVTAVTSTSVSYASTATGVATVVGTVTGSYRWGDAMLDVATAQPTVFAQLQDLAGGSYDYKYTLTGGTDPVLGVGLDSALTNGYDLFQDSQTYDISLVVTGGVNSTVGKYVVDNIAEVRRDCVAFLSIVKVADGTIITGTSETRLTDAKAYKTAIGNSTYAVIDSGFKYQYDKYNDKYRWIALNADVAGLCARTDAAWFSPAGLAKGQIKGAIKLAWNPKQSERDILYPVAINPVVTFPAIGTVLFGDRTATTVPSAFDRINVRRLFLVLEKSIANSAKYQLFEINDIVTRTQFISSVEPFLRDVQGRRGIEAFKVIADETVNTPTVVAANEFRGTILVKPTYSINYITLTFTAVGPEVSFSVAAGA
jgi:hypothetical protein